MAERVGVRAGQRARQRAARDEHRREADPEANRAVAGEAAAAGQHRLNETPEEKEEPDGRDAEPAEDYRVHALMKQEEGRGAVRDPPSLTGRRTRLTRLTARRRNMKTARPVQAARRMDSRPRDAAAHGPPALGRRISRPDA
ncbi:hypothetical protein [Burkholderia sp. B10]|uniref:hypothetical protein n=1 Tax=Burkholderia sp. B10 TaxID=1178627 RepID=UPI001FB93719|nr:hypothetical protein [Burkholderia sp. B10]